MSWQMQIRQMLHRRGFDLQRVTRFGVNDYVDIYGPDAVRKRHFYNIGAGSFRHPVWTNVDHESDWYACAQHGAEQIDWDLLSLQPLPIEDGVAEIVYTSHTIEHVTDEADANLFREAHRILRPGGIMRITAPDIELEYRAYANNDRRFFYWADMYSQPKHMQRVSLTRPMNEASIQQLFLWSFAGQLSTLHADAATERISDDDLDAFFADGFSEAALNNITSRVALDIQRRHPGNHINWWSVDKLHRALRAAGFEHITRSGYGQSVAPVLRDTVLFDSTHPKRSLYVEAVK